MEIQEKFDGYKIRDVDWGPQEVFCLQYHENTTFSSRILKNSIVFFSFLFVRNPKICLVPKGQKVCLTRGVTVMRYKNRIIQNYSTTLLLPSK